MYNKCANLVSSTCTEQIKHMKISQQSHPLLQLVVLLMAHVAHPRDDRREPGDPLVEEVPLISTRFSKANKLPL